MSTPTPPAAKSLVIVNAGTSDPSSSRMLADRIARKTADRLGAQGIASTTTAIDLGPLAGDIAHAIVSGFPQGALLEAIRILAAADGVVVATPVYKAGMSGLFKSFVDVLDNDLLVAKPLVLSATAGTARHALVIDDQLRSLFAFMRALTVPTSVFAAAEDWADSSLSTRVDRASIELSAMITSGVGAAITGAAWDKYQHSFGGSVLPSEASSGINLDTDLMRLATGGSAARP
jgi:FMN reductase